MATISEFPDAPWTTLAAEMGKLILGKYLLAIGREGLVGDGPVIHVDVSPDYLTYRTPQMDPGAERILDFDEKFCALTVSELLNFEGSSQIQWRNDD